MGICVPKITPLSMERDSTPLDFEVPYCQTKPYSRWRLYQLYTIVVLVPHRQVVLYHSYEVAPQYTSSMLIHLGLMMDASIVGSGYKSTNIAGGYESRICT